MHFWNTAPGNLIITLHNDILQISVALSSWSHVAHSSASSWQKTHRPSTSPRGYTEALQCHSFISPSSLHEAKSPASLGFQATELTSWVCPFSMTATRWNEGWSGSPPVRSSWNTRILSSPQAVAMRPVNLHLKLGLNRNVIKMTNNDISKVPQTRA